MKFSELVNKFVSFQIWPSAMVTAEFSGVKVINVGGYEGVTGIIDPAKSHALYYPTLPAGTSNDYKLYEYVTIKLPNGKITALGVPWIKENTIEITGSVEFQVVVRNKTLEDAARLRKVLMENNFSDIEITSVNMGT